MTILLDAQADPAAILAALESEAVEAVLCCEMQFASAPLYASNRTLSFTSNGKLWQGYGDLVGVSEVAGGAENLTPLMEYSLGIPWELLEADERAMQSLGRVAGLMGDEAEYKGRMALLSIQLFSNGVPIGSPFVLHTGKMEKPRLSIAAGAPVVFTIQSESILIRKRTPPAGKLTDKDQTLRHPTDRGLEFVANAASEPVDWMNS